MKRRILLLAKRYKEESMGRQLSEQKGFEYDEQGRLLTRRRSLPQEELAARQQTLARNQIIRPGQEKRTTSPQPVSWDYERDELLAGGDYQEPQRSPNSVRRYTTTQGQQVIERGNQRIIIHQERPPRRYTWLICIGIGMVFMLALYVGFQMVNSWWQLHQDDVTYGMPRTW